jgi:sarcosine oxidase subunit beta
MEYDVIIIGSGVIGAAMGFELSKAGFKTLNIDKNHDAGTGSTSASCAIIRVHYSTLDGSALAYEGYFDWKNWAEYLGVKDDQGMAKFVECGCLVMETEQNGFLEKHKTICSSLNVPFDEWNSQVIKEKLPFYNQDSFAPVKRIDQDGFGKPNGSHINSGVFFPTGGYVTDPQLSAHNLRFAAEANGGKFKFNSEIIDIIIENEKVTGVSLSNGEVINSSIVINVAGPASSTINKMAGVEAEMNIKTRPLRQEVAHVPQPLGFDFQQNGFVISDSDIGCYVRPEHGGNILIGSEDPDCDPREFVDDKDFNNEFTDQWDNQVHRYAQRVPTLGIPSKKRGIVDLYDASDDWIPIYDKSSLDGFYMACGTSGNQYKNATVAARMMVGLINYCESGNDHDTVPYEFNLEKIGRKLNVGFFSRLRKVNPESSNSVLG